MSCCRFWDDWIRQPDQRKDRACIRPEISRTKTFGKIGVSKYVILIRGRRVTCDRIHFYYSGLFYEKHLKFIKLNDKFVPFTQRNLTFLLKVNLFSSCPCSTHLPYIIFDHSFLFSFGQENYDVHFLSVVYNSPVTTIPDLVSGRTSQSATVRVTYRSKDQFKKSAKSLGLMDDFKVRASSDCRSV